VVLKAATVKRPRPRYYVGRHEGGRREHLAADNRALTPRMDLRAEPLIPKAYSWLVCVVTTPQVLGRASKESATSELELRCSSLRSLPAESH
jgi:hypothetical protein